MLVNVAIAVFAVCSALRNVEILAVKPGARRGDNGYIGVFFFNGFIKRIKIAPINLAPVFVSEADIFKVVRLGAAVCGSYSAPICCVGVAVCILNQIQHILHIILPFVCAGC